MNETAVGGVSQALHDELFVHKTMKIFEWIELAITPGVESLEFHSGFLEDDEVVLHQVKSALKKQSLDMPMLYCSPDFTELDPRAIQTEIEREKRMIEITAFFEGQFCRVLTGQRRPGLIAGSALCNSGASVSSGV